MTNESLFVKADMNSDIPLSLPLRRWLHNPKVMSSSPNIGKKNFSFCKSRLRSLQEEEAHANEINHDIHLANTVSDKSSSEKNMAAICNGISLFMLALSNQLDC